MSWQCTKPKNMTRNVHSIMKKSPLGSQKILFELCQQFDTQLNVEVEESSESENDDSETNHPINVLEELHDKSSYSYKEEEDF